MANEHETFPKTHITVSLDGVIIEIQASESIAVKGSLSSIDMNNLTAIWLVNQLQRIDQLSQQVQQLSVQSQLLQAMTNDDSKPIRKTISET